jgi:cbb3-type cytochrome oxidase subunit 3
MTEWDMFIGSIIVFGLVILGIVAYLYDEEGRNG